MNTSFSILVLNNIDMLPFWLGRLTFLASLSALVLAIFWPHVGPKILPLAQRVIIATISALLNRQAPISDDQPVKRVVSKDHPKFSGGSLVRMNGYKESMHSAYRSMEGFGHSPIAGNPSFAMRGASSPPSASGRGYRPPQSGDGQSSMSLTIFAATMVALVMYTLIKMLTSRLSGNNQGNNFGIDQQARCRPGSNFHKVYKETRDLKQDKRKFARLSREERTRQLILHHGGRNVSSAIKFLVNELEKQKHSLLSNLTSDSTCNCSCHAYDSCERSNLYGQETHDKLSNNDRRQQEHLESLNNQQQESSA